MSKINQCWTGKISKGGYMTMNWFVGYGNARFDGVCRHAFLNSYGLAHASLDRICSAVKKGILNAGENFYNDNSNFAISRTDSKINETTLRKYSVSISDFKINEKTDSKINETPKFTTSYAQRRQKEKAQTK
jgi:hypothetical protein